MNQVINYSILFSYCYLLKQNKVIQNLVSNKIIVKNINVYPNRKDYCKNLNCNEYIDCINESIYF